MPRPDLHAQLLQPLLRCTGKILGETAQNPAPRVNQDNSRCRRIDPPELRSQGVADEHSDRTRHFYAGRAGPDQHKCQEVAVTAGVFLGFCLLECLQNFVADGDSIREALHPRREFFKLVVAEVTVGDPCC